MRRMSNRTMHGFTGLAMRIRRVFWRFRRRSFSTSSSISRPTVLFFYFVIYFFSICFNLLQSPTTIVAPTGPTTNTGENILYTTSSRIAEILPFRDSVFIICCDGMMKEIKFNPDATKVFIVSEFQLQIPLHPNQPDSVLVNACQINHAIFDHVSRTFYFNLKREAIYSLKMSSFSQARSKNLPINRFITIEQFPDLIAFSGITVEPHKYLLFCCCQETVAVFSIFQSRPVLLLTIEMPLFGSLTGGVSSGFSNRSSFQQVYGQPYNCCIIPDTSCNCRSFLIVVDKKQSEVCKMTLQYYMPMLPGPAMDVAVVDRESLLLSGENLSQVKNPQAVKILKWSTPFGSNVSSSLSTSTSTPVQKMAIVDGGNERLQFFDLSISSSSGDLDLVFENCLTLQQGFLDQMKTAVAVPQSTSSVILVAFNKVGGNSNCGKIIGVPYDRPISTGSLGNINATL